MKDNILYMKDSLLKVSNNFGSHEKHKFGLKTSKHCSICSFVKEVQKTGGRTA